MSEIRVRFLTAIARLSMFLGLFLLRLKEPFEIGEHNLMNGS